MGHKEGKAVRAAAVGMTSFGGGLWLADLKAAAASAGGERQAAALLLAVMFSLFLAGLPAGWAAGGRSGETPLPVWLSMAGTWVVPVAAWFLGFSPPWPHGWAAGLALAFAGSWAGLGLGLGLLLGRKRGES